MSTNVIPEIAQIPQVKDLMQTEIVNVFETMPLTEVACLLTERRISGAPVVDLHGQVVGVISLFDLAARIVPRSPAPLRAEGSKAALPAYYGEIWFDYDQAADFFGTGCTEVMAGTASEVMSRRLVHIAPTASVRELATLMLEQRVHRVVVTDNGRVVGIVSTTDVLRLIPALVDLARNLLTP